MNKMIKLNWFDCDLYLWFKDNHIEIRYFRNGVEFTNLVGSSSSVFVTEIKNLRFSNYNSDKRKEKVIETLCDTIRNKLDDPRNENVDIIETEVDGKEYKKVRKDWDIWKLFI